MKRKAAAIIGVLSLVSLAACGGDDGETTDTAAATEETTAAATEETTAPATEETTAPAAEPVSLAGVCPETVTFQTDWNPESEHGFLYQLVGDNYEVDASGVRVTGPLVASGGVDTGVKVQVRAGGPAVGFSSPTSLMYQDPDIFLGFVSTDGAVQDSGEFPTMTVVAPFNINPQIIMWDPATYPDVKTIADLKATGAKVRHFGGVAYIEYFKANGILDEKQLDASYDGTPANFVADGGKAAQQGFATSEPYYYEKVLTDWGKPVAYQTVHDAGWTAYAQSLGGKPETIEKYKDCLKLLVPIIQQAQVDYVADPAETNALILDLVKQYNNGWLYDEGQAAAAVELAIQNKLIANSPDGTLGSFDLQRVEDFIKIAVPTYEKIGAKMKEGITAADIVTNEFIDPSIKLP
ncbi:MAG: ABC transporter substrate-binding protein [Actinobacteria bacterium]|nr:ABC transporter substrate-binding protein [Actinomycetota bacterium]